MRGDARRMRRGGQALAEMAVMVPVLVIAMMGFLDLGRAFYYQVSLTNAVREAARYSAQNAYYGLNSACAQPPAPPGGLCPVPLDSNIAARINQELAGTGFNVDPANVTISPDQTTRTQYWLGENGGLTQYQVTIGATYQFNFITPLIGSLFGGSLNLQTSAEMRTDY